MIASIHPGDPPPLATRWQRGDTIVSHSTITRSVYGGAVRNKEPIQFHFFKLLDHHQIETRDGERWQIASFSRDGERAQLELVERIDGLPPARYRDVCRTMTSCLCEGDPATAAQARDDFGLFVSPGTGLIRYGWRWWRAVPGGRDGQLLLTRHFEGRHQWIVLEGDGDDTIREGSRLHPTPLEAMGQGLRFAFQEEEWDLFAERRDYSILKSANPHLREADIRKWMAVDRADDRGWRILSPMPYPHAIIHPLLGEPQRWKAFRPITTRYYHPADPDRPLPGIVYIVDYSDGKQVDFVFPDPNAPSYHARLQGRKLPTLEQLADAYGLLPPQAVSHAVRRVELHTRRYRPNGKNASASYHTDERRVLHYLNNFREGELVNDVVHEVLGHGLESETPQMEQLWLSAMLADGNSVGPDRHSLMEDWAHSMELYCRGEWLLRYSNRFAVIGWLLDRTGSPPTEEWIQQVTKFFAVEGDHLMIRQKQGEARPDVPVVAST